MQQIMRLSFELTPDRCNVQIGLTCGFMLLLLLLFSGKSATGPGTSKIVLTASQSSQRCELMQFHQCDWLLRYPFSSSILFPLLLTL